MGLISVNISANDNMKVIETCWFIFKICVVYSISKHTLCLRKLHEEEAK